MLASSAARHFEIQLPLEVKSYDIDVAGIVSNIVYVRWLEDLRLAMLRTYLPLDEQMAAGIVPAILTTQVEYKRPIVMHENVMGWLWLSGLSKIRWIVEAEFFVKDALAARAKQEGCFISLESKRAARIPTKLMAMWRELGGVELAQESSQRNLRGLACTPPGPVSRRG